MTVAATVVGVILSLFVAWRILEALHYRALRRREERRHKEGRAAYCLWGVDKDGNDFRVRVRVPPKD